MQFVHSFYQRTRTATKNANTNSYFFRYLYYYCCFEWRHASRDVPGVGPTERQMNTHALRTTARWKQSPDRQLRRVNVAKASSKGLWWLLVATTTRLRFSRCEQLLPSVLPSIVPAQQLLPAFTWRGSRLLVLLQTFHPNGALPEKADQLPSISAGDDDVKAPGNSGEICPPFILGGCSAELHCTDYTAALTVPPEHYTLT